MVMIWTVGVGLINGERSQLVEDVAVVHGSFGLQTDLAHDRHSFHWVLA